MMVHRRRGGSNPHLGGSDSHSESLMMHVWIVVPEQEAICFFFFFAALLYLLNFVQESQQDERGGEERVSVIFGKKIVLFSTHQWLMAALTWWLCNAGFKWWWLLKFFDGSNGFIMSDITPPSERQFDELPFFFLDFDESFLFLVCIPSFFIVNGRFTWSEK